MQKNHFLLVKQLKNTESAQLWMLVRMIDHAAAQHFGPSEIKSCTDGGRDEGREGGREEHFLFSQPSSL